MKKRKQEKKVIHQPYGFYERFFKRPLDVFCALVVVFIFWWLYLIIALFVKIKLGSPVIFVQERVGKEETVFKLYKFRTMTNARNSKGELLPDEVRLTKFGSFLRSTSLDELPEVFNILKGDMSVVGPRPLLVRYIPRYNAEQHRRHEVRPGLTGYAQVHGRNTLSWEKRFELDVMYVDNITFFNDMKVLFDTVKVVLKREGINSETAATMEEFIGNGANFMEGKREK